jgi:hypothetical protein
MDVRSEMNGRARSMPAWLLAACASVASACPAPPPFDGGMDAATDTPAPNGYVRWSSVACTSPFDGSSGPADACTRPSPHASVTGLTTHADPTRLNCVGQVQMDDTIVMLGFVANETFSPATWPGSLELRGLMGAATASPTTVGQHVASCEIRLTEGTHVAVGHCSNECTVTVTQYYADVGTIAGTIRCGAMPDDSTPPLYRNVINGQGVPMMTADFALSNCARP